MRFEMVEVNIKIKGEVSEIIDSIRGIFLL